MTVLRETCPTCGARTFGQAACIICDEPFLLRHKHQITCAKKECRMARQCQVSKSKLAARFVGEIITCCVCKTDVPKVRINQMTCQKSECVATHSFSLAKRSR